MKRQICIIADALDEHYAGVHSYARELITHLLRLDQVNEYTFIHQVPNAFFAGRKEILIPLDRSNPFDVLLRKIFRTPAVLRQYNFDLIHDLFHIPPFGFRPISTPTVVTIHDLTPILFPAWHPHPTVWAHRLILPRVFKHTTRIIADSLSTARDIDRLYGRYAPVVRPVPLGSRGLPPPAASRKEFPFILFVGTLEPRKNIPVLVAAYEQLRRRGRMEKLVIIGKKGWHYNESMRCIEQSPFAGDILCKGFLDEAALAWHYHNASAFVYPSLYEGFGLPVLEAMKCGCPVVASASSSLPEVVGDAGLLVDPTDTGLLTEHLWMILTDSTLAQKLAHLGQERAKAFTWEKTAGLTLDVYREIFDGNRSG